MGTNWSRFSDATANLLAPLLAYEGLTAFFLEASFLGVLLFGCKLVPPAVHFFAGLMVAAGTLFSSFWILAVNSWMQTPRSIQWRGRVISLSIDNVLHTVRAVLERGEPMAVRVGGEPHALGGEPHALGGEALLASFGGLIVPAEAAGRPASTSRARHA